MRNSGYIIISFCVILLLIVLNGVGINFPLPWEDESDFIFQAIAFANHNTLFTDTLSSNRVIMWMQPAFMILAGVVFKIFGYSLEIARYISWVEYIASYILLATMINRYFYSIGVVAISITFFLPAGIAIANVARMESSILILSILTLYLLLNKRYISAFAVILIGVLFHFNMLYFLIALVGMFLFDYTNDKEFKKVVSYSKYDLLLLAISLSLVICYLIFVYLNLDSFIHDMSYQFARKLNRVPFYYDYKNLSIVTTSLLLCLYMFYKNQRVHILFALYALSAIMVVMIGQEGWYWIFEYIGIAIIAIILFDYFKNIYLKSITAILFILFITTKMGDFANMKPIFFETPYIDSNTTKHIKELILKYKSSHHKNNLTISFERKGVDLLFVDFAKKHNIKIIHELPQKVEPFRKVDIIIYITRPIDPPWLEDIHTLRADHADMVIVSNKNGSIKIIKGD